MFHPVETSPAFPTAHASPSDASPTRRGRSTSWLGPAVLLWLVLAWQVGLSGVLLHRWWSRSSPTVGQAAASLTLSSDECMIGILLMELNDSLALTPDQAQLLGPAIHLMATTKASAGLPAPMARDMLQALLFDSVFTTPQRDWLVRERSVVRAALARNPWNSRDRMFTRFCVLVQRRSTEAVASLEKDTGGGDGAHMTHQAFLTGLLLLEIHPATSVTREQATALQMSLAPALETARMTTALQERVPADLLGHLEERQKKAIRGLSGSTVLLDGRPLPVAQLPGTVEHLLQARAGGNVFPRRVTRGSTSPATGTVEPTVAAAGPYTSPTPSSPEASPEDPGVHLRGTSGLVLTQYIAGIAALEREPSLAVDAVQAARLQQMLPDIKMALEATIQRTEVPGVLSVENSLNSLLRMDQKRYIAAHVPETGPLQNLLENLQAVVDKRLSPKQRRTP